MKAHRNALTVLALGLALGLHYGWIAPHVRTADHDFDAIYLYIPLANGLVAEGWHFLAREQSIQAPVFSYLCPALLGRSLPTLKLVNAALSGLTLLLVFRTAWLAHSRAAGIAAAFVFAASPLMLPFLAAPTTEAPFLLLNALWIWGLAEWLAAPRAAYIAISALALALAALTRAPIFYWIPVLVVAALWLTMRTHGEAKKKARGALLAYGAALALPAAFIVKNVVLFGFPFYATGGSNALYLGNNPVTGGYDPNYLGLLYDVGSIARDQSALTLEAERLLGGVARFMILEQDPFALAAMHLRKLAAFVFVTNAEPNVEMLRAWRIATIVLAALGVRAVRGAWLKGCLVGILAYMVAVHVPVLYTHRYSVDAMDLWLTILAGVGAASLLCPLRPFAAAATLAVIGSGVIAGIYAHRHGGPPEPDVFRAARLPIWEGAPFEHRFGPGTPPVEVAVTGSKRKFDPSFNYVLVIAASLPASARGACGPLEITYRRHGDPAFNGPVARAFTANGATERHQVGALPLELNADGTLRLAMACSSPATLTVSRLAVYAPMPSIDYRERYLKEAPLFPGALER